MTTPAVEAETSISAARRALAARFRAAGLDSPELDARLLFGHVLGLDLTGLTVQAERPLRPAEIRAIDAAAARRLAHEPVARIIGTAEFWGLPLRITKDVLAPRPDTETVVEAALAGIDQMGPRARSWRIADLGTGSGALLLALLSELPNAVGVGTDRSAAALAVARDNADNLRLAARARFVACDYTAALAAHFDLVVSNPPYVASNTIATLAPEVRDFDPPLALDGGPDGLNAYRAITADIGRLLAPNARLVVEIGSGQADAVNALFAAQGFTVAWPPRADLNGIPRALSVAHHP